MHIEFLVEEPSIEATLHNLLPSMIPYDATYRISVFRGKKDLLKQLPARLDGYAHWIPESYRLVILIDQDRENCLVLKKQLEQMCQHSGLTTKSNNHGNGFQVLNRIVIEELESWFIGDVDALRSAYPRIPESFAKRIKFRDPDSVQGGTWESLEAALQKLGYFRGGYSKVQAARDISIHMIPERNRSKSFQVFREGLLVLIGQ